MNDDFKSIITNIKENIKNSNKKLQFKLIII